jgi:hypothetical protein
MYTHTLSGADSSCIRGCSCRRCCCLALPWRSHTGARQKGYSPCCPTIATTTMRSEGRGYVLEQGNHVGCWVLPAPDSGSRWKQGQGNTHTATALPEQQHSTTHPWQHAHTLACHAKARQEPNKRESLPLPAKEAQTAHTPRQRERERERTAHTHKKRERERERESLPCLGGGAADARDEATQPQAGKSAHKHTAA